MLTKMQKEYLDNALMILLDHSEGTQHHQILYMAGHEGLFLNSALKKSE